MGTGTKYTAIQINIISYTASKEVKCFKIRNDGNHTYKLRIHCQYIIQSHYDHPPKKTKLPCSKATPKLIIVVKFCLNPRTISQWIVN